MVFRYDPELLGIYGVGVNALPSWMTMMVEPGYGTMMARASTGTMMARASTGTMIVRRGSLETTPRLAVAEHAALAVNRMEVVRLAVAEA